MIFLLVTALLWGVSYGVNDDIIRFIPPQWMSFLYVLLGALMFAPMLFRRDTAGIRFKCMAIGAIQLGLMYLFSQYSYKYLSPGTVALLSTTTAVYVPLLNGIFQRKFSLGQFAIALPTLAFTRLAMVVDGTKQFPWRGILYTQLCNICYVLGQILYRRLHERFQVRDSSAMAWFYLGATIALIPTVVFSPLPLGILNVHWKHVVGEFFFLGVLCCGLGNYLWNRGAVRVNSAVLAICNNLPILFGIVLAIAFFGDPFGGWKQVVGVAGTLGLLLACYHLERGQRSTCGKG
ncbi:MAG: DMT family transporter [Puniceicoccales bacterium]|jgi:drug/metabolite transporter (DMT)-like permease|nr:DMT family transporter [Puniceicoccales bacterium]